jgi:protein phosphatase 2C family protein 2/3
MKITKDIEFIVMACDGVWDCVDAQKFCECISILLKSNKKRSEILAELFDQIIAKNNNSIFLFI